MGTILIPSLVNTLFCSIDSPPRISLKYNGLFVLGLQQYTVHRGTQELLQETIWNAKDGTWVSNMQGKCFTHCAIVPVSKFHVFKALLRVNSMR